MAWLAGLNFACAIALFEVHSEYAVYGRFATLLVVVVIGVASVVPAKKVAAGMGWAPATVFVVVPITVASSMFCSGLIGYMAVLMVISGELGRYGLGANLRGVRVSWIRAAARQRRESDAAAEREVATRPVSDRL